MQQVITQILDELRAGHTLDATQIDSLLRARARGVPDGRKAFAKKRILPYYLHVRHCEPELFESWNVDEHLDELFVKTMQMKPRRTASGVATITAITKPWPCSSNCIYCPNDIRMPKSYLHDEPACQRAERNFFDPYLQVSARLHALEHMGHATDKVELIVLGGTWSDYAPAYRIWFVQNLFRALNDSRDERETHTQMLKARYGELGLESDPEALKHRSETWQKRIDVGEIDYNEAFDQLYRQSAAWRRASESQVSTLEKLQHQHALNENAEHRVVGLVVETRPDAVTCELLLELRQIGCTKVQLGIQSLDDAILMANGRRCDASAAERALGLCRLFGFKTHVHFMLNLYGSTPESDIADYRRLVSEPGLLPDEVKLYPCALVAGTKLVAFHQSGAWQPYSEDELISVLCADMVATPAYMRVSRMIRDISAKDILVGNKKTNLRQLVEQQLAETGAQVREIRYREIGTRDVDPTKLELSQIEYETDLTSERFLQWVTPEGRIAGFLRLSLPHAGALDHLGPTAPLHEGEAMIREVHVYGFAAKIAKEGTSAQHHGLGKALVATACDIAREHGYNRMNVISAVGTRGYYRNLGFEEAGLYQQKKL